MTEVNKNVRGPDKFPRKQRPKMKHMTIRLPAEVVEYFHGSTVRIREALETFVRENKV